MKKFFVLVCVFASVMLALASCSTVKTHGYSNNFEFERDARKWIGKSGVNEMNDCFYASGRSHSDQKSSSSKKDSADINAMKNLAELVANQIKASGSAERKSDTPNSNENESEKLFGLKNVSQTTDMSKVYEKFYSKVGTESGVFVNGAGIRESYFDKEGNIDGEPGTYYSCAYLPVENFIESATRALEMEMIKEGFAAEKMRIELEELRSRLRASADRMKLGENTSDLYKKE